jgi:hypothetical protein
MDIESERGAVLSVRADRCGRFEDAAILLGIGFDYLTALSDRSTSAHRMAGTNNVG